MNVLVVDGNPIVAQILSSYVERFGYAADETYNGREAIRRLQDKRYDLVITDSEIVSIDGPELCKFIKSHFQDIFIIGTSGYLSALKDLEDAGADVSLSKPFCIDQLKKAMACRHLIR